MGNFDQKVNKFIEIFCGTEWLCKSNSGSAEYTVDCSDRSDHRYH